MLVSPSRKNDPLKFKRPHLRVSTVNSFCFATCKGNQPTT